VMTSRAFDIPAGSAPAVLDDLRHAVASDRQSAYLAVLNVLRHLSSMS
jgi:hypothetical protein